MNQRSLKLACRVAGIAAAVAVTGCGSTTPNLDSKFGEAVSTVREQQAVYPTGTAPQDPGMGIGGKPAVHAQERYQDSFKTPPRTFEVLGIGGTTVSGSGQ
jgi:hypothetical protein